jgi:hypothetical protein
MNFVKSIVSRKILNNESIRLLRFKYQIKLKQREIKSKTRRKKKERKKEAYEP